MGPLEFMGYTQNDPNPSDWPIFSPHVRPSAFPRIAVLPNNNATPEMIRYQTPACQRLSCDTAAAVV